MLDNKTFNIVHIVSHYPPYLGGMENVVEQLALIQSKNNNTIQVITSNDRYSINEINDKGIEVIRLRMFEIAHTPIIPGLVPRLMKFDQNTVFHVHIAQACIPEIAALTAVLKHIPYVVHLHIDVKPSGAAGFLLKLYKPIILKQVLRSASKVIVFTDDQKNEISTIYGVSLSKIVVLKNGADDKYFRNIRAKRRLHSKPRLLFVGRISIQKNLPFLLQALDGISSNFETRIVGDGDLMASMKGIVHKLRLRNIVFVGKANSDALLKEYEWADCFVLPSTNEGMPLVLLESMAMGLPIIGTNVTGIKDVVKDHYNGLLIPLNNVNAFRNAILELGSDKDIYSVYSENSKKSAAQYRWVNVAKNLDKIYAEVLES
jgi:glycosyltransferase involved in cell wall biosynthesis